MNEPNENGSDKRFTEQAKAVFDDSVERLDAAALSRLNQSRHAALEALHGGRSAAIWGRWVPATGVAASRHSTLSSNTAFACSVNRLSAPFSFGSFMTSLLPNHPAAT